MDIISMSAKQLLSLGLDVNFEDDVNPFLTKSQFDEILGLLKNAKETRELLIEIYTPSLKKLHCRTLKLYRNKNEYEYLSKQLVWKVQYNDLPLSYVVCSVNSIFSLYRTEYLINNHLLVKDTININEIQPLITHFHNFVDRSRAKQSII